MKYFYLILLIISGEIYSQEIIRTSEIFTKNDLAYRNLDSTLFTGKAQGFKLNGHLLLEKDYINGILRKYTIFFNGKEKIVSDEEYYDENRKLQKTIRYSLDHKIYWIKYYNEFGNKILEEDYKDGILVYSCPYFDNKKNGIVFSINEKGERNECKYKNGKLIKN